MLVLPLVRSIDIDEIAHFVEPAENPRSHALLEIFRALPVRLELPVESARARIVRREQRGAAGVVANAEDLVEDALLELAVLAALADLVDGQYVHVTQRLEPLARGETAREAVADVGKEQEELFVATAYGFFRRQLPQNRREQVRLSASWRSAEKERALARRPRYKFVHETTCPSERDHLIRADSRITSQCPIEELRR